MYCVSILWLLSTHNDNFVRLHPSNCQGNLQVKDKDLTLEKLHRDDIFDVNSAHETSWQLTLPTIPEKRKSL